jgi:LmbE family N-acetylglucosaminyl deacetylase
MLPLDIGAGRDGALTVLCLGAHSDDIEIGCGGTLLRLLRASPNVDVHWVVFSSGAERDREARESACLFLKSARRSEVLVENFRNGYFPFVGDEIKDYFERRLKPIAPDVVFTHYRNDRHQDHRVISDLTWNTFRNHLVLEYEIPKYDGDLGTPNVFVPVDDATCEEKVGNLMRMFGTQRDKHWFTEDTFRSLMRLRAIESASADRYAEAFYGRKLLVTP